MATNFIITSDETVEAMSDWYDFLGRLRDAGAPDDAVITTDDGTYITPEAAWRE